MVDLLMFAVREDHTDWFRIEESMSKDVAVLDVAMRAKELSGRYENVVVAEMNDQVVRLSLMTEPYFWHYHPNSDETFVGVEGIVIVEMEGQSLELGPGQLLTVPRGVRHRTAPGGARSVNLTIEGADMETVRV
jgi:mannose-6-phosphate isomerase-like protein (cupin superfamily)